MISFTDALEEALLVDDHPVVTDYDVFRRAGALIDMRVWNSQPIKHLPQGWDQAKLRGALRRLVERQAIAEDRDFRSGVWRLVQSTKSGSAEEVACIADPFCYVSHLSAMQRYGLSDRNPAALHLTTPRRPIWNQMRDGKIAEELALIPDDPATLLARVGFKEKLRRRPVVVHETSHPTKPTWVRGEHTRIVPVGQTFVDMLSEPALCGGMRHVLDVWETHAAEWLEQVIPAVDASDAKIVKVRAGYILTERLDVDHPKVAAWQAYAQRGGSRKLDPEAPYEPVYSENWMISLNV